MNVARPIFRSATLSGRKPGAAVGISFLCVFAVFIMYILSGLFPDLKIYYYFRAIKSTVFYTYVYRVMRFLEGKMWKIRVIFV